VRSFDRSRRYAWLVVALLVMFVSAYLSPKCLRELRNWAAQVRADIVTNIVQPGRFISIERGLVFHLRERLPNGQLLGLFIDDRRNPNEETTLLAERGEIVESDKGTFLLLGNGSLQRLQANDRDPTVVKFDRHAFDLSQFSQNPTANTNLSVREMFFWELLFPKPDDPTLLRDPGQFRAEFHDRVVAPLYPLAFALIAFAWLGAPRTTRQNRGLSMIATILAVSSLRLVGFASMVFGIFAPALLSLQYIALVFMVWASVRAISAGTAIEIPAPIVAWFNAISERLQRRVATA